MGQSARGVEKTWSSSGRTGTERRLPAAKRLCHVGVVGTQRRVAARGTGRRYSSRLRTPAQKTATRCSSPRCTTEARRSSQKTTSWAAWQAGMPCGLAESLVLVILTDTKTSEGPNLDGSDRRFRDSDGTCGVHTVPHTARPLRSWRGTEPAKADLMPDGLNGREPDRNSMGTRPNPHRWPPGRATPATSQFEPGRDGMLSVIMSTRTRARESAQACRPRRGSSGAFPGRAGRRPPGDRGETPWRQVGQSRRGAISTALPTETPDEPLIGPPNPKYSQSRTFAELLIDCEEDRTLRAVLVEMLREMERRQAGTRAAPGLTSWIAKTQPRLDAGATSCVHDAL
jgi:hypothetical protein